MKSNFKKAIATSAIALGLAVSSVIPAYGHGWIVNDRAHLSSNGGGNRNSNMGGVAYEPQSAGEVNSRFAVEEGRVSLNNAISASSGNIGGFPRMSDFGVNRFHRVAMTPGNTTMQWWFTAPHRTSTIVYYISRPGFNPNAPLNFADFEQIAVFDYHGLPPAQSHTIHTHNINIPANRSGAHVIMVAWHVSDNNVSWYRVKDVYITNNGSSTVLPDPNPAPDPGNSGGGNQGGSQSANTWTASAVFVAGDRVVYNGITWQAQWWTQGERPGTTGDWGVWRPV